MDVEKEEIEQLKRDLYTYGYYLSRLKWYESKLQDIQLRIQDNYEASGISYDEPMGSSDPYHPAVTGLIMEESKLLSEKHQLIVKKNALEIDKKLKLLNPKELTIIEMIFFYKKDYRSVSKRLGYSHVAVHKKVNKALMKMLKSEHVNLK